MIDLTPSPIALQLGPIPIFWYGVMYALGLGASYWLLVRQSRRAGLDDGLVANGMIVVSIAALIGGRLYHVIDQWKLYEHDLLKIVLPPYSGLGVYGGLVTGLIAFLVISRRWHMPLGPWLDVLAPALFLMQAIGRWGNFFNQELYGPPTTVPWGIAIDCAHRLASYPCSLYPEATTHFQPLFLYESLSGLVGMLVLLWLADHARSRLRSGDLFLIFFIWYGIVRFSLEFFRAGYNWTIEGIATAQIFSTIFALGSLVILVYRHLRPPKAQVEPAEAPTA